MLILMVFHIFLNLDFVYSKKQKEKNVHMRFVSEKNNKCHRIRIILKTGIERERDRQADRQTDRQTDRDRQS